MPRSKRAQYHGRSIIIFGIMEDLLLFVVSWKIYCYLWEASTLISIMAEPMYTFTDVKKNSSSLKSSLAYAFTCFLHDSLYDKGGIESQSRFNLHELDIKVL